MATYSGTNLTYETVCKADTGSLERLMREGSAPAQDSLAGYAFRGYNTSLTTEIIRTRKFFKCFEWDAAKPSRLVGFNQVAKQNGIGNPWLEKMRNGEPVRQGHYEAYPVRSNERDSKYPHSLLLNYGAGDNPIYEPAQLLRDYLVQISADNADLLLGKAFGSLGPIRLPMGYFVLERHHQLP
jgi:hypothetical protein